MYKRLVLLILTIVFFRNGIKYQLKKKDPQPFTAGNPITRKFSIYYLRFIAVNPAIAPNKLFKLNILCTVEFALS